MKRTVLFLSLTLILGMVPDRSCEFPHTVFEWLQLPER